MKTKQTLAASAALLLAVPLMAESVNGFENFTLSRNDFRSNPSSAISGFSSRTHADADAARMPFTAAAAAAAGIEPGIAVVIPAAKRVKLVSAGAAGDDVLLCQGENPSF